jgi:branched-chain amino acid transport system permease protein
VVSAAAALRPLRFLVPAAVLVGGSALIWGPPLGIVVNGAILGCLTALLALGLALVYRANRIVNFAQADMGAVPALLSVLLLKAQGWPLLAAIAAGAAAAALLGALTEFLFVRRFFRAPRLILTVATLGISQLLIGLALFMPGWFGEFVGESAIPPMIHLSFTVGDVHFFGNDVLVLVVTPAVLLALAGFMRFSDLGVALRGAAESADRAAMLGVNVKRVHSLVWVLASLLAFTALLLRAGVVGPAIGRVLSPSILLLALAAAVIGRMQDLPTIVSAGIGLGVVDQSVKFAWDRDPYRDLVVALVVFAVLLVVRERSERGDETSTWDAVREVRPVPSELRDQPEVQVVSAATVAVVAAFLLALPAWLPESRISLASAIAIFGMIGCSLVVLTGWAGQVSLGQMGFVGVGAATAGAVTSRLGWDLSIGLVAGGLVGAVAMILVGLPALRARGLGFPVATLAFGVVASSFLLNPQFFGDVPTALWNWLPGTTLRRPDLFGTIPIESETAYYYLCVGALAAAVLAVHSLRRSRSGRVLIGARENERQAQAYGVDPRAAIIVAFGVSGFLAGFAGALFFHHQTGLPTQEFYPAASLEVFATAVVGGLGSAGGAVLGAVYVRSIQWFLPGEWQFLATGAGLLLVLLVLPGGLGAALGDARDALLRRLARRKGIRVPSLVGEPVP